MSPRLSVFPYKNKVSRKLRDPTSEIKNLRKPLNILGHFVFVVDDRVEELGFLEVNFGFIHEVIAMLPGVYGASKSAVDDGAMHVAARLICRGGGHEMNGYTRGGLYPPASSPS